MIYRAVKNFTVFCARRRSFATEHRKDEVEYRWIRYYRVTTAWAILPLIFHNRNKSVLGYLQRPERIPIVYIILDTVYQVYSYKFKIGIPIQVYVCTSGNYFHYA